MAGMDLPCLIVCGSQAINLSDNYLAWLRITLLQDSGLQHFVHAIRDLPSFWDAAVQEDTTLERIPGKRGLQQFQLWLDTGDFALNSTEPLPNMLATPLTVITHVVEYADSLKRMKCRPSHLRVLDAIRQGGGVQGFCTGFLAAIVIACSRDEQDIGDLGAVALRLATVTGAHVDLDCRFADPPRDVVCFVARWPAAAHERQVLDVLESYPESYISVKSDATAATFTSPASEASSLMQDLSRQGVQVKEMQLKGRFHTSAHQKSFQRLKHLCDVSQNFRFPATTRPLVPLRLNVDGKMVNAAEPLHVAAIRSILLDVSDWHRTLSLSLDSLVALSKTTGRKNVMVLGLDDCIPRSIKLNSGIRIERLSGPDDAKRPGFKDGPEYQYPEDAVAVVGMACRYPGADSLEEFWEVIESGRSMLGELPEGRFPTKGLRRDPEGKFRFLGNFLRNVAGFDHRFFKRSSREAASMDPQHRLVLEVAYETLESYGYFNQTSPPKNVGCYMGVATSDYEDNVASHSPTAFSVLGTIRAFTSGRISHFFGWTGPSVVLDTACSSSLVAIHTACKAVIADECSMALAGGVNIITSPTLHQNLAAANFLTSTGGCKAFDSRADGYCRGEGAGLVLLKKLSCAISDGDQILGVIVGSAVNQNDNAYPITVPVSSSQTALYRRVLGLAAMDAQMVSYVEAHGTGTPKGDPTECQSIKEVFGGQERRLHFGSVKGNTGHTEAAAGVAGLIKVLLMIQKRKIPPQASFASLNPNIPPLEADNMAIARTVQPWNAEFKVACVNNYGAAGSNASVIIAQPPVEFDSRHGPSVMCLRYPIIISANTHESLGKYAIAMREFLTRQVSIPNERLLASTAFHLTRRHNSSFPFNAIFSAASVAELDDSLRICAEEPKSKAALAPKPKPVVLVFGGQTSNIIQFSEEVYRGSLVIRTHLDECDLLLREMGLEGIFPGIFKQEPVADVGQLHCMLFSLQYACAVAWIESGLQVQVVIGHSFGQLTALCVAGVLSLQDTLRLISGRASLIKNGWGAEPGSMLLVESKPVEIQKLVRDFTESNPGEPIEIACYNGPSSFVLVGSESAIDAFELTAASEPSSFKLKRLPVTHGFHSRFVDNILPDYLELAQSITYREPRLPIETCSRDESWRYFTAESVAEQSRQPVYFADAVERVARRHGACTWIEAGSSSGIVNMVRRALADPTDHSFHLVKLGVPEPLSALAQTTVDLWKAGVKVQFWPFHRRHHSDYMPLNLPPYQFERTRHWLDYVERRDVAESSSMPSRSVEAKPTLVSFLRYQDPQGRIPEFSVNQSCELYQTLVRGHAMLAKDLCPASLYVEIAASAASHLVPNYLQSTHNPRIENLRMHAPLGIDPSRGMNLTLAPSSSGTWEFSLCSYAVNGDGATEPIRHADGRVAMTATEHGKDTPRSSGYRKLADYGESLLANPSTASLQGPMVYKLFDRVVIYSDIFHGVKKISTKMHEVAGTVSIPEKGARLVAGTACNPILVDNFTQVAGLHVNSLDECGQTGVFLCNGIDEIVAYRALSQSGSWLVYSRFEREGERQLACDIFAFDAKSRDLVMTIFGVRFSRVLVTSLRKALQRANQREESVNSAARNTTAVPPQQEMPPAPSSDLGAQPEQIRQKAALLGASSTSEQTRIATKVLLHEVADVPLEEITDDAALEDLGIDSLMASELLSAIRDRFDIEISASCYEELLDFKALYRHIDSKIDNYSSAAASCYGSETDCGNTETPLTSPGDSAEEYLSHDEVAIDISHRNLVDKLSELFAEHLGASDRIASDMPLHRIGIDSLMGIELAADIEKVFSKKLDLAALEPDCTFGELCDMVTPRKQHPERAKIIAKENTFPEESTPARFAAEARIVESDKCGDKIPTMETVQFAEVDGVPLHADIYYPAQEDAPGRQRPIALMIHGGGHVMLSRKDIRPKQTQLLLDRGLLPVSVDYRLCPEVTLTEGPIRDVCTALQWARERLPTLPLQRSDIRPRGDKVVVVGWSTGGTLSMTLPFTAPQRGVQPPDAILAFYCPTDYESSFWREPNYPERTTALMAEENYDLLEGVQEQPITGYNIPAHKRAVDGWMAMSDPRSRIVLHMNWKGQALPVLLEGLPCKGRVTSLEGSKTWLNQPQPSLDLVRSVSPYAQIVSGNYKVPTFLIHGTKDDLVPWQQTQQTKNALEQHGVRNGIAVVEDAVHLFDLYRDRDRRYWEAVLQGYEFIFSQTGMSP